LHDQPEVDPNLVRVIDAWAELPVHVQQAILALIAVALTPASPSR
jgi:hypothetical protein